MAVLGGVAFVLHYLWENAHIELYTAYDGISGPMPIVLYATLGDVAYTLFAYALFALYKRDAQWVSRVRMRDCAYLALLGFSIAVFVEWKAMFLERWAYTPDMPLVFGLGLSPILQMTILLPLSVILSSYLLVALSRMHRA